MSTIIFYLFESVILLNLIQQIQPNQTPPSPMANYVNQTNLTQRLIKNQNKNQWTKIFEAQHGQWILLTLKKK